MTQRSYRMYVQGYAETGSAELEVVFNGRTVFSGPVPTTTDPAPIDRVTLTQYPVTWQEDIAVTGAVAMSCTTNNGAVIIGAIEANYSGVEVTLPADPYTASGWTVVTAPQDFWADPNNNDEITDGKNNCQIDGNPFVISRAPGDLGDATIRLSENSAVTFDLNVDPALVVTDLPPWPPQE